MSPDTDHTGDTKAPTGPNTDYDTPEGRKELFSSDDPRWFQSPSYNRDSAWQEALKAVRDPTRFKIQDIYPTPLPAEVGGLKNTELEQIGGNVVNGVQRITHEAAMRVKEQQVYSEMNLEKRGTILYMPRQFAKYLFQRTVKLEPLKLARDLLLKRRPGRIVREWRAENKTPDLEANAASNLQKVHEYEYDFKALEYKLENISIPADSHLKQKNYLELVRAMLQHGEANSSKAEYLALLRQLAADDNQPARDFLVDSFKKKNKAALETEKIVYTDYVKIIDEWIAKTKEYYGVHKTSFSLQRQIEYLQKKFNKLPKSKISAEGSKFLTKLGDLKDKKVTADSKLAELQVEMSQLRVQLPKKGPDTALAKLLELSPPTSEVDVRSYMNIGVSTKDALIKDFDKLHKIKSEFEKRRKEAEEKEAKAGFESKTAHQLLYLLLSHTMGTNDAFLVKTAVNLARVDAGTNIHKAGSQKLRDLFLLKHHPASWGKQKFLGLTFQDIMERLSYLKEFRALETLARDPRNETLTFEKVSALALDPERLLDLSSMLNEILRAKKEQPFAIRPQDASYLQHLIELLQRAWTHWDTEKFAETYNKRDVKKDETFILKLLEHEIDFTTESFEELLKKYEERGIKWPELVARRKNIRDWYWEKRKEFRKLSPEDQKKKLDEMGMKDPTGLVRAGLGYRTAKEFLKEKAGDTGGYIRENPGKVTVVPWLLNKTVVKGAKGLWGKYKERKQTPSETAKKPTESQPSFLKKLTALPSNIVNSLAEVGKQPGLRVFPPKKKKETKSH